jgi:ribosomal protein S18
MIRKYKSKNIKTRLQYQLFFISLIVTFHLLKELIIKNVALLRKFISVEGKILHRRFTGLTAKSSVT